MLSDGRVVLGLLSEHGWEIRLDPSKTVTIPRQNPYHLGVNSTGAVIGNGLAGGFQFMGVYDYCFCTLEREVRLT